MSRYIQPHICQFDGGAKQGEACVPASIANGIAASTGGARRPASQTVHALIPKAEETNPKTPGWSMTDADRACQKAGVPFTPLSSWANIEAAHNAGHYLILQGDSDVFANSTCSGAFNGDHCIGVHPNEQTVNGVEFWWIDDPICRTGRWERKATIRAYAQKLSLPELAGRFDAVVPAIAAPKPPAPTTVLRYGGTKLTPRQIKRIKVPSGRRANVRKRPDRIRKADVTGSLANGRTFAAYQRTTRGVALAGSKVWYGDQTGTHWLHNSSF